MTEWNVPPLDPNLTPQQDLYNRINEIDPHISPKDIDSYIIFPGRNHEDYKYPDLLVSMKKSIHKVTWYKAHEFLKDEGSSMLTIRQFIDFLELLYKKKVHSGSGRRLSGKEVTYILNGITQLPTSNRQVIDFLERFETLKDKSGKKLTRDKALAIAYLLKKCPNEFNNKWLDAHFDYHHSTDHEGVGITYGDWGDDKSDSGKQPHRIARAYKLLKEFSPKDGYFRLSDCNKFGMPTKIRRFKGFRRFRYFPPPTTALMKDLKIWNLATERVATFTVNPFYTGLSLNTNPYNSNAYRAVKVKEQ